MELAKRMAKTLSPKMKAKIGKALFADEFYKYIVGETIITPAMKQLRKLQKVTDKDGKPLYDPSLKKSQVTPKQAEEIITAIKARWKGMDRKRKIKDALKAINADYEFLTRDTSLMG